MSHELRITRLLRWLVYTSAFVPLIIFSQYISPFHFGKIVVFRSMVELMLVLYLLVLWRDRSYSPRMTPVLWAVLAFAGAFSLTTFTSVNQYASFWGTLERMGGLFTFWHYVIFVIVATSVLRTQDEWLRFFKLSIAVSVLSALYGFGQKTDMGFFIGSGGRERIFGTIGNAALFAGYEIVNAFLALTLLLRQGISRTERWWLSAATAIDVLAIIMSAVRGSLLGLGAGSVVLALLYYRAYRGVGAKRVLWGLLATAIIFLVIITTPLKDLSFIRGSRFLSRITDTSFKVYTAQTRFWAWRIGLQGWAETPKTMLLGWGPENFNVPFSKRFDPRFFTGLGSETYFDRAHNMFVEVLVTMGLVGFLAYVSIFVVAIWMLVRLAHSDAARYERWKFGFLALLVAYIIHNSFIFDTSPNFIMFFLVLGGISMLWNTRDDGEQREQRQALRPAGFLWGFTALVMLCGIALFVWRINIVPAKANYATTRAIVRGWSNDFTGALTKFKEALSYNVPGIYEYRHRLAQYLLEYTTKNKELTPEITNALQYGISEVQKNVVESHRDYLPYLYLSRLNIVLGRENAQSPYNDEALRNSLKALEISPTFVRTYYEIGQAYLNKKDNTTAAKYFQKAIELNPEVGLSYWYLGMTLIDGGDITNGMPLLKKAVELGGQVGEGDFLRLIPPLLKAGDYPNLVWTYEQLTGVKPQNAPYFAALAYAYAKVGRIDDAVTAARQTVLIDPKYMGEAQQFVRSLGREL